MQGYILEVDIVEDGIALVHDFDLFVLEGEFQVELRVSDEGGGQIGDELQLFVGFAGFVFWAFIIHGKRIIMSTRAKLLNLSGPI